MNNHGRFHPYPVPNPASRLRPGGTGTLRINSASALLVTLALGLGAPMTPLAAQEILDPVAAPQPPSTPQPPPETDPTNPAPPLMPKLDPGQADLDEAVLKRIEAETNADLESVAALIESALTKGLSDENVSFAKKMLGSIQLQRGQGLAGAMMRVRGRQQVQVRDEALRTLNQAVQNDPELADAWLLIARLNLLPDGKVADIEKATTKAIELLTEQPKEQSNAYLLRAVTRTTPAEKLADLNAAIQADPKNTDALRERAAERLRAGEVDTAVEDLGRVLELEPTNQQIATAAVQQLMDLERADDAVALLSKSIQAQPSEGLYRLRAILYRMLDKDDEAFADLNKALAMQPKDPLALLQRAEIALGRDDVKSAKADLKSAIAIEPRVEDVDQAILLRCFIAADEGRIADAITDMKTLVDRRPDDVVRQIQLANLYLQDDRPRQAITTLTDVLDADPKNVSVLRSRGDAFLAVGEHLDAIQDYENAIAAIGDEDDSPILSGLLNNLAWVLATSPKDDVRNGKRAVELGKRAVELTNESEAHILSTLAAGYAEIGDFENAIRWSEKAVTAGRAEENEQLEQLEKELEMYRTNKPWREEQDKKENVLPLLSPDDVIDT